MRAALLVSVLVMAGCGASGLAIANVTGLGVSTAALACDWGQTRDAASNGWRGQYEENPIMGRTPSTQTVDLYFLSMLALNAVAWRVVPRRWRLMVPVAVIGLQARSIAITLQAPHYDIAVCGLR